MVVASLLAVSATALHAQRAARVRTAENFRRAPNGELLARLTEGAPLLVVGGGDGWLEVVVEGWIWARSLQVSDRQGMDLVVSAAEGENLRDAPSGEILGRVEARTLFEEVAREPGWIHVRRQGWIWEGSVEVEESQPAAPSRPTTAARPTPEERAPVPPPAVAIRPTAFADTGPEGVAVLAAPDGDTLAFTVPGAEVQTLGREGSWVRVRIEGWSWIPESGRESEPEEGGPLTPADLRADPAAHRGRVVSWRLQFISLERAERIRADFFEGEPFLLCRFGSSEGPFVYVAVPPERVAEVEGLVPLEFLTVTGRIRTGASQLTGSAIVDLLSLDRGPEGP